MVKKKKNNFFYYFLFHYGPALQKIHDCLKALQKIFKMRRCWMLNLHSFRNGKGLKKKITNWKKCAFQFFPIRNFSLFVFVNHVSQDCSSYLIPIGTLKNYEFSLNWGQEQFSYLFNFYVAIKEPNENQVVLNYQILDHLSSFFCHF